MPATVALISADTGASGSGVITSAEGLILTAAHVTDGAEEVVCADSSPNAFQRAGENADRNGVVARVSGLQGDAFDVLRALREQQERFDLVILDPPAFIKRRKDRDQGLRHYALNNRLAMRLLTPGGIIVSASCSQALSHEDLLQQMRLSTPRGSLGLQVLAPLQQGPDHPVNIAMPETLYLTGCIARLL